MNALQNKLWPNTDGNLGKIKVQIPAGTADDPWLEGDALVGNFVYKNGKLVGFIDVAALIPNESGETTIPYDTINTKFPGILKDTFIINAGERCKYQFAKLEEDIAVYTSTRLFEIMDADKFKVSYDKDENKVTVSLSHDTTAAQIADVESLLERVLPRNLVTEFDPFPVDFTRVEYLEGTGGQYIDTGIVKHGNFTVELTYVQQKVNRISMCGYTYTHDGVDYGNTVGTDNINFLGQLRMRSTIDCVLFPYPSNFNYAAKNTIVYTTGQYKVLLNDVSCNLGSVSAAKYDITNALNKTIHLFAYNGGYKEGYLKIYNFSLYENGKSEDVKFIPALDPTGAPCLFDLVTRKPFYNSGTGDFLYPGAEQAVQTLDLDWDSKFYAKLTEHGVRRLYHVPKGYAVSMDEYAAANGFKELVEPPMPLEGYWMPQWRETETQLICDWIETEPPVEEEI